MQGDIETLINAAVSEPLESSGAMCDAAGTKITAVVPNAEEPLLPFGVSTCSQDGIRKGNNSSILMNIANGLCGDMR